MKLTLWILYKHILCFNLRIILIVYQNSNQHGTKKKYQGGFIRRNCTSIYPSLSVFPVMDFSIFAISPFTWNTKHVCYHLQNFIRNQFQIEKKLKTKSCSCTRKYCKLTIICVKENFVRFTRASSSRILLDANYR